MTTVDPPGQDLMGLIDGDEVEKISDAPFNMEAFCIINLYKLPQCRHISLCTDVEGLFVASVYFVRASSVL